MESSLVVTKKDVASELLHRGGLVVHLDPRGEDVVVPFRFKHLSKLSLPIGLRPDQPTNDLRIDDQGLAATLQFRRMKWECQIPWRAIFAIAGADGEGVVWPDDIREEDRPAEKLSQSPIPIPKPLTTYLVVNGRAIAGEGWSLLIVDGEQVSGATWIDYTLSSVRLGGDLAQIKQCLATKLPASNPKRRPSFRMSLGYVAGEQNCRVDWANCRIRAVSDAFIEIGAGESYELRVGSGAGPLPYIREWFTRLKRFLRLN